MTEDDFKQRVNGAPIDITDVAQYAAQVSDNDELREIGEQIILWLEDLEEYMEENGIELG